MRTIEYRQQIDGREAWGPGPWQDEPDKVQWRDEATGLPCLMKRNSFGALCGYVGVGRDHPAYETEPDVSVHGGLTFAGKCQPHEPGEEGDAICHVVEPGEDDDVWWLGFDAMHGFDYAPELGPSRGNDPGRYRDTAYVADEVRALAQQLAAMT